jgi:hypothetical protein
VFGFDYSLVIHWQTPSLIGKVCQLKLFHPPVADFVKSLVRGVSYGQNSHEFCYRVGQRALTLSGVNCFGGLIVAAEARTPHPGGSVLAQYGR